MKYPIIYRIIRKHYGQVFEWKIIRLRLIVTKQKKKIKLSFAYFSRSNDKKRREKKLLRISRIYRTIQRGTRYIYNSSKVQRRNFFNVDESFSGKQMYLLSPPFHFQSYRLSISLSVDVTRDISTHNDPIITEEESRELINFFRRFNFWKNSSETNVDDKYFAAVETRLRLANILSYSAIDSFHVPCSRGREKGKMPLVDRW